MTVNEKIKTIDNKIDPKALYNLNSLTAKILLFSSGNVGEYEFLTDKDILREIDLLQKAAKIKRSKYWPSSSEWNKNQHCEKKYQGLGKVYKFDIDIDKTKNIDRTKIERVLS